MLNKIKLIGFLISLVGVVMVRANPFDAASTPALYTKMIGVMVACAGIAVFAGGINKKVEKRIRVCPKCYKKNDAEQEFCRSCKQSLKNP